MNWERSQLMTDLIRQGIVDTILYPWGDRQVINSMRHVERQFPISSDNEDPNTFNLASHPRSERWQEHYFAPVTHADPAEYWAVEVARIIIPQGELGILKTIEQVLYDVDGNYYATNKNYWGSPYNVLTDVANCRWYFKLEWFDGIQPEQFNLQSPNPIGYNNLPGYPFPELQEIDALWYPAGGENTRVKMLLPDARMLRFYFMTPPTTTYQWTVTGRLRALLQTTFCAEAAQNARRS